MKVSSAALRPTRSIQSTKQSRADMSVPSAITVRQAPVLMTKIQVVDRLFLAQSAPSAVALVQKESKSASLAPTALLQARKPLHSALCAVLAPPIMPKRHLAFALVLSAPGKNRPTHACASQDTTSRPSLLVVNRPLSIKTASPSSHLHAQQTNGSTNSMSACQRLGVMATTSVLDTVTTMRTSALASARARAAAPETGV